jgi:3-oxoadipate:acetyl-CoA acetyltransferase
MDGIVVNLAPTGMVPTKQMSPHVPISVDQIVGDAIACVELGANILHLHARAEDGTPTYDREVYARLIGSIREKCPAVVICVSASGRHFGEYKQRADVLGLTGDLKPDMASLTLTSMNFSRDASVNSPDMVRRLAEAMREAGIKPELEAFDTGMINYARYLADRGVIDPPYYFDIILGNVATAQAKPAHLALMIAELPDHAYWSGGGIGGAQLAMNAMGIMYGHGVRVGLEDCLWMDDQRTQLATNAGMVRRVVDLAAVFGKRPATPGEIRAALAFPNHG